MTAILICIGIYVAFLLLTWLVRKISEFLSFFRYSKKLNTLKPELNQINTTIIENKLTEMSSLVQSTTDRLRRTFHISLEEKDVSIREFIEADANSQNSKRRQNTSKTTYHRKRYRR
jgi:hypothetical protein